MQNSPSIDGPAGSGKSSVARASRRHWDTCIRQWSDVRALALKALRRSVSLLDDPR